MNNEKEMASRSAICSTVIGSINRTHRIRARTYWPMAIPPRAVNHRDSCWKSSSDECTLRCLDWTTELKLNKGVALHRSRSISVCHAVPAFISDRQNPIGRRSGEVAAEYDPCRFLCRRGPRALGTRTAAWALSTSLIRTFMSTSRRSRIRETTWCRSPVPHDAFPA